MRLKIDLTKHLFRLFVFLLTLHCITALTEFRLEDQNLIEAPQIPENTKSIIIRNTSFSELDLLKLDGVKYLDLSRNSIDSVSQKTLQSAYLISINLSCNAITEIEVYAFTISPLKQLDLSSNRLRKLHPLSAKPLLELQILHLDNNHIEVIPEGFFEFLFKLEVFTANGNYLKTINLRPLYYLQHVELSNNYLQSLVLANPKVTDLNLSCNSLDIAKISGLAQCSSLLTLDLSQNPIGNLSPIKLPKLEELRLSSLKLITSLELTPFPNLKILDLSNNDFPHLGNLTHLASMNLLLIDGNKLTTLNFSLPDSLTYIGLNDNEFACTYLEELLPSLRRQGIRLYFNQKATGSNVQGVRCVNVDEGSEEKYQTCNHVEDEDFVYAWHTSVSSTVCLMLAVIYISILWKCRAKVKMFKDHENGEDENVLNESEFDASPITYNNLLIKYNNDT